MTEKMSKRLLIAKDAMCAILSNMTVTSRTDIEQIVSNAYKLADELLKQEESV